jgi:hypothetical protein
LGVVVGAGAGAGAGGHDEELCSWYLIFDRSIFFSASISLVGILV